MTPPEKSIKGRELEAVFGLGLVLQAVVSCIPEDADERLAAGVDPQQICDETMGRVMRKYAPTPGALR